MITEVSVVTPAYNMGEWLPQTLTSVADSIERAGIADYEIVVVDDGSTDDTADIVSTLLLKNPKIVYVHQSNAGRLPAVQKGLATARYRNTLIINPRVDTFPDAFVALNRSRLDGNNNEVWNGHVKIRYGRNLFARFWGVVTHVGWYDYFRKPRYVEFGLEEFDRYPKGTGFLLAPTVALRDAARTFDSMMEDPRYASDDTGVLRNLAETHRIAILPEFGCWYAYGRSGITAFARHTFDRGTFFVDSYYRRGTRFYWPLNVFIAITMVGILGLWLAPMWVLVAVVGAWVLATGGALVLRAPLGNVLGFALVAPLFTLFFALGLWRGFFLVIRGRWRRRRA